MPAVWLVVFRRISLGKKADTPACYWDSGQPNDACKEVRHASANGFEKRASFRRGARIGQGSERAFPKPTVAEDLLDHFALMSLDDAYRGD